MAYQTIISAKTIEEFQSKQAAIDDIPVGSKIRIKIELPSWAPFGNLADMAGAEWFASAFAPGEMQVTDVYGSWRSITIEGIAIGTPVLLLVAIIVGALSALGIAWFVSRIILEGDMKLPDLPGLGTLGMPMIVIALIAIAAITWGRRYTWQQYLNLLARWI